MRRLLKWFVVIVSGIGFLICAAALVVGLAIVVSSIELDMWLDKKKAP